MAGAFALPTSPMFTVVCFASIVTVIGSLMGSWPSGALVSMSSYSPQSRPVSLNAPSASAWSRSPLSVTVVGRPSFGVRVHSLPARTSPESLSVFTQVRVPGIRFHCAYRTVVPAGRVSLSPF